MLIGLIRHGLTDWNAEGRIQGQSDIPLNDEGRGQAEMLGDRLLQETYRWDFCITSSLSRAAETGRIVAAKLGIPMLEPDDRIRERAYGQVEGMTAVQREEKWGKDWNQLSLGQETDDQLQARALAFMEEIAERYPEKNILVISHGGFLAQLYIALYKDKYSERLGNLSLTILEKKEMEWNPLLYNCTRHILQNQH
ncbi:phosphoglycerate kinase [Paenibacillus helianthi]|uniref:Phosphoglycerate kinase n=1 Tax=Paenibacillus helianthi TaxID=1349432 RepID=A0ABX3ESJ4_9BACL|nr:MULTISPECIES: histidine phosphatase family protein [Paenibacillus]OKP82303.1 phosphoglycerate kinase [Paenibacillus sp. P3E]OKP84468.1 phosphoglycerate kinase [Paenibacillus sp. P32E]OKP86783.1 phosphoglycerate kinase [Paenibacillus helianthi]